LGGSGDISKLTPAHTSEKQHSPREVNLAISIKITIALTLAEQLQFWRISVGRLGHTDANVKLESI
jgi:hypothetical protein